MSQATTTKPEMRATEDEKVVEAQIIEAAASRDDDDDGGKGLMLSWEDQRKIIMSRDRKPQHDIGASISLKDRMRAFNASNSSIGAALDNNQALNTSSSSLRATPDMNSPYALNAAPDTHDGENNYIRRVEGILKDPDVRRGNLEQEQKLEEQRAARQLSMREALEETKTEMPVRQRIKEINTAPTTKKVKPVQSAVIGDYRRPELPPVAQVIATPPPRVIPRQPKTAVSAPAPVSPSSPTATESLEAEIRDIQNALLKAEEDQARVEPKSVANKKRSVASRTKPVPMGSKSVASNSPSVASRQRPVPSQGSVRVRPMSVANKSQRRKPETKEAAPPVPSSAKTTVEVEVKTPPKAVRKRKVKVPQKVRQPEVKAPPKVVVRDFVQGSRQPFQGSRQPCSTAPADKTYTCMCTIM
jgi:hypothetical protein